MGLLLSSGCIVPQDDYVLTPLPAKKNRPVRIIPQQVSPADNQIELRSGASCSQEFYVAVEDPDVDNVISWSFYIDFEPGQVNPFYRPGQIPATANTTIRPTFARGTFSATDLNIPLFTVGQHTVDVYVTDTTLDDQRQALPASVTSDGGMDPGYTDSFTWFVTTVPGDCI